jgi:hypothetical protein
MSKFIEQRELFDKVICLGAEDQKEPLQVLKRFFSDYRLHEVRHILWSMVEVCLTTENDEFGEPGARADLLLRFEHFQELLEAGWLLVTKT